MNTRHTSTGQVSHFKERYPTMYGLVRPLRYSNGGSALCMNAYLYRGEGRCRRSHDLSGDLGRRVTTSAFCIYNETELDEGDLLRG